MAGEPRPFDHAAIDDIIHGRIRLGVMAYLSGLESALFGEVRDAVGATDGNLSAHARKLEDAGYVEISKAFAGRRPQTRMRLTPAGRAAWGQWLAQIDRLAAAAAGPRR